MKKLAPYLIFLAAMLWATDAPFRMHLTKELSSSFIVLAEHFVDVLFVFPILFINRLQLKRLRIKHWLAVIAIAVGGSALASVAFTQAFHYVNPSVAILLQKLQPLIAIGLAASILDEKMSRNFWLYALLAIFGAYIISFPSLRPEMFPGEQFNPNAVGAALALLAAALWGASTVLGKFVLSVADFKIMTGLRFVLAFVFLAAMNVYQGTISNIYRVTAKDAAYVLIIAVASGVVSLFIYYGGLKHTKASIATLAELGFPMAAVVVNWVFLDAVLAPMQLAGMAILLFAVTRLANVNREPRLPIPDCSRLSRSDKENTSHGRLLHCYCK